MASSFHRRVYRSILNRLSRRRLQEFIGILHVGEPSSCEVGSDGGGGYLEFLPLFLVKAAFESGMAEICWRFSSY